MVEGFIERESPRLKDRPALAQAIAAVRQHEATLIISKLGKLDRSVSFLSTLAESGINFTACDNLRCNPAGIYDLIREAQSESRQLRSRTIDAADSAAERLRPVVEGFIAEGKALSIRGLCRALNDAGYTTASGGEWHPTTVRRLLDRLDIDVG